MKKLTEHLDSGSIIVMSVTLLLFILALFVKGIGHDILLEAGVFLVSLKLMIATYRISVDTRRLEKKIDALTEMHKK